MPTLSSFQSTDPLPDLEKSHLTSWDTGVFNLELCNLGLLPLGQGQGINITEENASSGIGAIGSKLSSKLSRKLGRPTTTLPGIGAPIALTSVVSGIDTAIKTKLAGPDTKPETEVVSDAQDVDTVEQVDEVAPVSEGTFSGTLMALTETANRLDNVFATHFSALGVEQHFPIPRTVAFKQSVVNWDNSNYPPHCAVIPTSMQASATTIFNNLALANVASILAALVPVQNGNVIQWVLQDALAIGVLAIDPVPTDVTSISQIEKLNLDLQKRWVLKNAYDHPNVGNRTDWYSDQSFAGQQFVGTNPTTIKAAPADLVAEFVGEAKKQNLQNVVDYLGTLAADSLYVQDYRDFRDAVGVASDADLKDGDGDGARFQCAAVVLFNLNADGVLHPLAIIIDYKVSAANSVTIFNKRLRASDSTASEATDWPWRYAKLCAQVSDWARHEIQVHLTDTHLVEEVTIVAALRAFADTHPVYTLLSPHWLRTLSLNASARNTLVPQIIMRIVGFTEDQSYKFINHSFSNFDWEGSYPPNDLKRRGFPNDQETLDGPKYHNYAFARDILPMWAAIKSFVHDMLAISYSSDSDVANDADIQTWCDEIRGDDAGKLKSFPAKIETIAALEDAIAFCIHIATNQHTAVNYLQQYYMTFVPNKPAALCVPLPQTLGELQQYKEQNIINSYPINRPAEWLLSSHVPWLLSFRVEDKNSLSNYAQSLYQVNAGKKNPTPVELATAKAAKKFYDSLVAFTDKMLKVSKELDDQTIPYTVLHPAANAVSILI